MLNADPSELEAITKKTLCNFNDLQWILELSRPLLRRSDFILLKIVKFEQLI